MHSFLSLTIRPTLLASFIFFFLIMSPVFAADTDDAANTKSELGTFLAKFAPADQQAMSNFIDEHSKAKLIDKPASPKRIIFGSEKNPVQLVEWIDIQCPHCKNLSFALEELKEVTPPNSWAIEARHYPLDIECNPNTFPSKKPGVSCLAAKILICLSGQPTTFDDVKLELFRQQSFLSVEGIWNTVTTDAEERKKVEACVNSPETAEQLKEDIDYAEAHNISGTPLVVINGKPASSIPPVIYALILAKGDSNAPDFATLPAPKEMKHDSDHDHDH